MRYPASEKLEIIRIVEQSHLPAKQTLDQLGIARRTFYRWYDRYLEGGPEALEDRPSAPSRVWNRIEAQCIAQWGQIQHGVLPGTVADVHAAEVASLMPLGRPFDGFVEHAKRVSPTCLISFERNRYSVSAKTTPPTRIRQPDR